MHQVQLKYSKLTLIKTCKGGKGNTEFVRTSPFAEVASLFFINWGSSASIIAILENVTFLACPLPELVVSVTLLVLGKRNKQKSPIELPEIPKYL